jgi:HK97 family phage major capsid protein
MAMLTPEQLKQQITDVVVPLIKEHASKDVADLVRQNVETALANTKASRPNYAAHLFGDEDGQGQRAGNGGTNKALTFGAYVMTLAGARGDRDKAVRAAQIMGRHDVAEALEKSIQKAMSAGDPLAGGFLVPQEFSTDVIELLRASGVVRSLNPLTMAMSEGIKIPKITSGSTATYIGENTNIPKSELGTGQIQLSFKKLAALVPISNDLIRKSVPGADGIVRDDVVRAVASREDLAFIRNDGTSGTPKGIKHWIAAANKFNANGTVNLANVTTDLGKAVRLLMDANITLTMQQGAAAVDVRPGWIFAPRIWQYLFTVQTSLGTYAFRDEMLRGTLWGWPFRVTSQIPITMSAGADTGGTQSEVYFGAFAHAVIGEALGIIVDASQEAAYHDGSAVVATYSQDQTVIRVITEHDFALRHDRAFSLIEQATWGA